LNDDESLILTDKSKLSSVISNLIKNSIKFTDSGGVIEMGFERKEDKFKNRKLKILIVEDDEINRLFLSTLLNGYCKELIQAEIGKEAVEICKKDPNIDLVFMDIKMPVMDGFEATKGIRSFNKDIKIIAQTGYVLGGDREKILASGFNDYISKPVQREKFESLIKFRSFINYIKELFSQAAPTSCLQVRVKNYLTIVWFCL